MSFLERYLDTVETLPSELHKFVSTSLKRPTLLSCCCQWWLWFPGQFLFFSSPFLSLSLFALSSWAIILTINVVMAIETSGR